MTGQKLPHNNKVLYLDEYRQIHLDLLFDVKMGSVQQVSVNVHVHVHVGPRCCYYPLTVHGCKGEYSNMMITVIIHVHSHSPPVHAHTYTHACTHASAHACTQQLPDINTICIVESKIIINAVTDLFFNDPLSLSSHSTSPTLIL